MPCRLLSLLSGLPFPELGGGGDLLKYNCGHFSCPLEVCDCVSRFPSTPECFGPRPLLPPVTQHPPATPRSLCPAPGSLGPSLVWALHMPHAPLEVASLSSLTDSCLWPPASALLLRTDVPGPQAGLLPPAPSWLPVSASTMLPSQGDAALQPPPHQPTGPGGRDVTPGHTMCLVPGVGLVTEETSVSE